MPSFSSLLKLMTEHVSSPDCVRDTVFVCRDGKVAWSSLFLLSWSNLVRRHMRTADLCDGCEARLVLMLPDFKLETVRLMLLWSASGSVSFSGTARQAAALESLLDHMGVSVELSKTETAGPPSSPVRCTYCAGSDGAHSEFCQSSLNFLRVDNSIANRARAGGKLNRQRGRIKRSTCDRTAAAGRNGQASGGSSPSQQSHGHVPNRFRIEGSPCLICSIGYGQLDDLRAHLASDKHHADDLLRAYGTRGLGADGQVPTQCGICGRDFASLGTTAARSELARHIGMEHEKLEEWMAMTARWQLTRLGWRQQAAGGVANEDGPHGIRLVRNRPYPHHT